MLQGDDWDFFEDNLSTRTGYPYIGTKAVAIDPRNSNHVYVGARTGLYEFMSGNGAVIIAELHLKKLKKTPLARLILNTNMPFVEAPSYAIAHTATGIASPLVMAHCGTQPRAI